MGMIYGEILLFTLVFAEVLMVKTWNWIKGLFGGEKKEEIHH